MKPAVSFVKITPTDTDTIHLIADWYAEEWNIDRETTMAKVTSFPEKGIPFHYLLLVDGEPAAAGGIHTHVGLLNLKPEFSIYGPWLALVYTPTDKRNRGYGTMICQKAEEEARLLGIKELYLFTFTAEKLYTALGWSVIERFEYKGQDTVVMKKVL